jgi:hypothetical protein
MDLILLQNLVKVEEMLATDRKNAHPSLIVLLNSLGLVTRSIAYRTRPS